MKMWYIVFCLFFSIFFALININSQRQPNGDHDDSGNVSCCIPLQIINTLKLSIIQYCYFPSVQPYHYRHPTL